MNGSAQGHQAGFTLLETVVATTLTASLTLCAIAAVVSALHSADRLERRVNLSDHALNILSDLRESTAYDPKLLEQLVGRKATTTFSGAAANDATTKLQADLAITQTSSTSPINAVVTVSDDTGNHVTEQQTLSTAAPAPGSVIDISTAAPSLGARP